MAIYRRNSGISLINNTAITLTLNDLVNDQRYDKRLRPNYGQRAVEVGITIHVSSISGVSEVAMDYTLDIYLRQAWKDGRLAFEKSNRDLTIGVEYIKSIWVPDTFFPNEKSSFFHQTTTHNSFLRITPEGSVLTSQRLTVTATCPMELQHFPLDSQVCILQIESYGYSSKDIKYTWSKGQNSVSMSDFKLPQFEINGLAIDSTHVNLSTGSYSRLECRFRFTRNLGFYLIQIYLPSQLIVIISWVSFWLSRDATPARVSLGVTTVLTMTTLMTTTNASMPKVSYIKSIDIYLITCFLMVFASLLEYATVGYLNKRLRMETAKLSKKITAPNPINLKRKKSITPLFNSIKKPPRASPALIHENSASAYFESEPTYNSSRKRANYHHNTPPPEYPPWPAGDEECLCDLTDYHHMTSERQKPIVVPSRRSTRRRRPRRFKFNLNPGAIDKYSRLVFPLFFALFNATYWASYFIIRDLKIKKTL